MGIRSPVKWRGQGPRQSCERIHRGVTENTHSSPRSQMHAAGTAASRNSPVTGRAKDLTQCKFSSYQELGDSNALGNSGHRLGLRISRLLGLYKSSCGFCTLGLGEGFNSRNCHMPRLPAGIAHCNQTPRISNCQE